MGKGIDIALILDKVSKKGGTAATPAEDDEDPNKVAAEAQVEKFFTKGKAGDFAAATSALAAAMRLCGRMESDVKDDDE